MKSTHRIHDTVTTRRAFQGAFSVVQQLFWHTGILAQNNNKNFTQFPAENPNGLGQAFSSVPLLLCCLMTDRVTTYVIGRGQVTKQEAREGFRGQAWTFLTT